MTDRRRYPRSGCCVPFCRRTSTLFPQDWLCGTHWRLIDRGLKAYHRKMMKRCRLAYEKAEAELHVEQARFPAHERPYGIHDDPVWPLAWRAANALRRWHRVNDTIWSRMKAQAIERAATSFI